MKLLRNFTLFFFVVLFVQDATAQDPRYSQYYAAPLRVNPALTGVFDGTWRVGANYRTQWGSVLGKAYNTFAFTGDLKVPVFKSDFIGIGFSAMSDVSGESAYNTTELSLGINYQKKLSGRRSYRRGGMESYLTAGVQVGFGQRSVKWKNLTYSTQYVQGDNTYNQSIYSGENPNVRATRLYPDFNAGLMWYGIMGNRKNVYAGLGMYHLTRPDISLFNRPPVDSNGMSFGTPVEKLYSRWTVHAGGEFLIGGNSSPISLLPGLVAMFQGPSMEINFGLSMKYQGFRNDDFAFKLGIWSRLANKLDSGIDADALIFLVGIDYLGFQFGVSYDVNISSLSPQTNGRGSLELSVMYTGSGPQSREQGCPSF
ncbi:MAG: type IX secretion system membrane protein PorP/SprF [Aureispira sp.]|nr:type IX secretion system membrane protein PorP/SprF [Aureispira sp.]